MNVLQLCNYYCGSKVHAELFRELDSQDVRQTVYVALRDSGRVGINSFEGNNTSFVYAPILKLWHRYLYHAKSAAVKNDICNKVLFDEISLCHASTLFTDGIQAYNIYKERNIPYIVTLRGTDIKEFLSKAPHTWLAGKKVLLNASAIIFLSPAMRDRFCCHKFIRTFLQDIEHKFITLRNGINDFWIDHIRRDTAPKGHHVLFVGRFLKRKNLPMLIKAVIELQGKYPDIELNIVGGGGDDESIVKRYAQTESCINYYGMITDKTSLLRHYQSNNLFAMPSVNETFGLVYLEALSQNLPVIYTHGTGIDGVISNNCGEGLKEPSIDNIKNAIAKVFEAPANYTNGQIDFEYFRWRNIAKEYVNLYHKIVNL